MNTLKKFFIKFLFVYFFIDVRRDPSERSREVLFGEGDVRRTTEEFRGLWTDGTGVSVEKGEDERHDSLLHVKWRATPDRGLSADRPRDEIGRACLWVLLSTHYWLVVPYLSVDALSVIWYRCPLTCDRFPTINYKVQSDFVPESTSRWIQRSLINPLLYVSTK